MLRIILIIALLLSFAGIAAAQFIGIGIGIPAASTSAAVPSEKQFYFIDTNTFQFIDGNKFIFIN